MLTKQQSLEAFKAKRKKHQYLRLFWRDWDNGQLSEDWTTFSELDEVRGDDPFSVEDYEQVKFNKEDGTLSLYVGYHEEHLNWINSEVVGKQVVAYAALEGDGDHDLRWAGDPFWDELIRQQGGIPTKLDLSSEQREELAEAIGEVNGIIGCPAPGGAFYTLEAVQEMIDAILNGRVS